MDQKPSEKKSIAELFQQVWGQALVAVNGAEEEAMKVISRVGWSQVKEFTERLAGQRREIEGRVDITVRQSLSRLRVPRREEIAQLKGRVEALAARVEKLSA